MHGVVVGVGVDVDLQPQSSFPEPPKKRDPVPVTAPPPWMPPLPRMPRLTTLVGGRAAGKAPMRGKAAAKMRERTETETFIVADQIKERLT